MLKIKKFNAQNTLRNQKILTNTIDLGNSTQMITMCKVCIVFKYTICNLYYLKGSNLYHLKVNN